jgi:ATP-binding cassette subfamily B protein RaxB
MMISGFKRKSLPVLRQSGAAECGLVCIAMVMHYHGNKTSLSSLRKRFPFSMAGATLLDLIRIADEMSLNSRPLKAPLNALGKLQTPCILHWDLKHFVVLKQVTRAGVTIHDPAKGDQFFSFEQASQSYTGIALELVPSIEFKQNTQQEKLSIRQLWQKAHGLKRSLSLILTLSFVMQLFVLAMPFYAQLVIDDVLLTDDSHLLNVLAIGFCFVYGMRVITQVVRSYAMMHLSNQLSFQMTVNVFRHLLKLPNHYFFTRHIGDIISRFSSIRQIKDILTTGIITAIVDGFMAIGLLIMMLVYSPTLTFVVLAAVACYLAMRLAYFKPMREVTQKDIVAKADENTNFMETVKAIKGIKLFAKEPDRMNLWQNKYAHVINQGIKLEKLNISFKAVNELLFGAEFILVIFIGAGLIMADAFSVGMLIAFIAYKDAFLKNAFNLVEKLIEFKMLDLHLERISDVVFTEVEQQGIFNPKAVPISQVACQDLSYRYSSNENFVFKNLSLQVSKGEFIAITGPSGCGKTTLLNLLMAVLEPTYGEVLIDDQSLKEYGIANFRHQMAAVTQDDQLLSGSIGENISFFSQQIDQDWLEQCAKMAAVYDDIMAMPMKFEAIIGDMGAALSGGQKQRVLLARALYKRPNILFLDEATSHLDHKTESMVNQAVKALNITRIVIAHRRETIVAADRILSIENGNVQDITKQYKPNKSNTDAA